MKRFIIASAVFLLSAGILHAADVPPDAGPVYIRNSGLEEDLGAEVESYVKEQMTKLHSPGIAIGIVKGDRLVYEGYFGYAQIEDQVAVSESTVFRIGSISKTFTAMGLMQQWERGRFKLDDDVNSHVSEPVMRPKDSSCQPATFKHLFTHTSGGGEIMSYRMLRHPVRSVFVPPWKERLPLADIYEDGIRPRVCPESKWAYCNFCYGALGLILEELSGESFQDYTRRHILDETGMHNSSFYETEEIMGNLAQGYHWVEKSRGYKRTAFYPLAVPPPGNMYSTVPDMAKYLIALLNGGSNEKGTLVAPETLELMYKTHYQLDERQNAMGISFLIYSDLWGHRVLAHGGAVPGFGSQIYFVPDRDLGLIVFGNVMASPPYEIAAGVLRMLLGGEKPGDFAEPEKNTWPLLEGYYGSEYPEFLSDFRFNMATLGAFRVVTRKDELVLASLRREKSYPLLQVYDEDPYFYLIEMEDKELPAYITFLPGPDGRAASIVIGMNEYVSLTGRDLARVKAKAVGLAMMPRLF